jgi:hypothetical protein
MNRILLAEAIGWAPGSTRFRDMVTAANKYGLITGNYNSEIVSLATLGERAASPRSEEDHLEALRQAMQKVSIFAKLLQHYNNNRLPAPELLKSIIERPPFSVNPAWSAEAAEVFMANGRFTGVVRDVGGSPWVILEAGPPIQVENGSELRESSDVNQLEPVVAPLPAFGSYNNLPGKVATTTEPEMHNSGEAPANASRSGTPNSAPRQFFVAHGRDATALAQLQSILKDWISPTL